MEALTHSMLRALLVILGTVVVAWASGQSASHGIAVTIPDYIGLRIVGVGTGARMVVFDFVTDPAPYMDAINNGTALPPTSVNRFSDVELNVNRNGRWYLDVFAAPLSYVGAGSGAGLLLAQVHVSRGARSGLVQDAVTGPGGSMSYLTRWTLSPVPQGIASATRSTSGWRSLGFNGYDYEFAATGDEEAGTYSTIVTYLLTAP